MARRSNTSSRTRKSRRTKVTELELPFPRGRGQYERLAKHRRKPKGAGLAHLTRETVDARKPVHVSMKLRSGLPSLRTKRAYRVLLKQFAKGRDRFGFRLNQYSVMRNHLHLVVEAEDNEALARGMQGLSIRIAKALNKLWGRKGRLFLERYHAVVVKAPAQMRHVLAYVLKNARRHGLRMIGFDPFSSAAAFKGWTGDTHDPVHEEGSPPVVAARSWVQRVGWKRHDLVPFDTNPRPAH